MNLGKYVQSISKAKCNDCKFNTNKELKRRPIIIIPSPNTLQVMLISRDPTIDFIPIYEYSERYSSDERRRILFASAIPYSLIVQIIRFLRRENHNLKGINNLFKIFEVAYWTHLHKCPTDGENKFTKECANRWLKKEIDIAKEEGIKAIICLGKDVKDWIDKNIGGANIERIYLPHPSGANAKWYTKNTDEKCNIKKNIEKLVEICQKI